MIPGEAGMNLRSGQFFHLAFPVRDIAETRKFYTDVLGCRVGRSSDLWIDFDMFGHQVVAHKGPHLKNSETSNPVDGHDVPVPHFGVILSMAEWQELADRLNQHGVKFVIKPHIRFRGQPGEQATMFFLDPSGNALEFKAFKSTNQIFQA